MAGDDLLFRSASAQAALVRSGELSARELVEASLARIEALDGRVNAFTLVDADGALAAADAIAPGDQRPFAGCRSASRTWRAPVAGLVMSNGSDLYGDYTPDYDANVVRRIRDAGFVIVGKTNTPELGIVPVSRAAPLRPQPQPVGPRPTPGGSSGRLRRGGGGAAWCRSRTAATAAARSASPRPVAGSSGSSPAAGASRGGPTLGDAVLLHRRHAHADRGGLRPLARRDRGLRAGRRHAGPRRRTSRSPPRSADDPGKLRIGLVTKPPIEAEVDPICERAARDAAELLGGLGHEVSEVDPPWSGGDQNLLQLFTVLYAANIGLGVAYGGMVSGREPRPEDVERLTWEMFQRGLGQNSIEYMGALSMLQRHARGIIEWMASYDLLLTPALAQRPLPVGTLDLDGDHVMAEFARTGLFTPFTAVWNVTGQPAISLPLYQGDDGLPTGVQLVGPPAGEALLLSVAARLESEQPWADRRPQL